MPFSSKAWKETGDVPKTTGKAPDVLDTSTVAVGKTKSYQIMDGTGPSLTEIYRTVATQVQNEADISGYRRGEGITQTKELDETFSGYVL